MDGKQQFLTVAASMLAGEMVMAWSLYVACLAPTRRRWRPWRRFTRRAATPAVLAAAAPAAPAGRHRADPADTAGALSPRASEAVRGDDQGIRTGRHAARPDVAQSTAAGPAAVPPPRAPVTPPPGRRNAGYRYGWQHLTNARVPAVAGER